MLLAKNLDTPDDKRSFERGELGSVTLGGVTFSRAVLSPGWRWSEDVKPIVGTDSCQVVHVAVVISGGFHVQMADGEELELGPGDAHVVGPGHDAWVLGDEPCVVLDFAGSPTGSGRKANCPCGVSFRVDGEDAIDHLVAALQEHARNSHDHEFTSDQVLAELEPA